MDDSTALANRLRSALQAHPVRERRMFGALCFLVNNKMAVSAMSDGGLLVRVDPHRSGEFLALDGARQAEMGEGRSMGDSWISVAAQAVATDEQLAFWIDVALAYNEELVSQA